MNEVKNLIIGFQLGRKTSQICYYDRKQQEPVSLATKVGSTLYEFPTVLYKESGEDNWHFGLEAEYFGQQSGWYVDDLYSIIEQAAPVLIDGKKYEPWQLLGIFLKESLKMLGIRDLEKAVSGLTVTLESLDTVLVDHLKKAFAELSFQKDCCRIQSYSESFYYYTMYQKPELRSKKVALLEFLEDAVVFRELYIQHNTRPALVRLSDKSSYPLSNSMEAWDVDLFQMLEQTMERDGYSVAYLIGDGFKKDWALRSLPRLARAARKIYSGNNLFVKGACYGAKEKCEEKRLKEYLYLGEDLVRTNVGMEMIVHGMHVYYPLIKAGMNWYDASHTCDFILDGTDTLVFLSGSMQGGEKKQYAMPLPDLPVRPNRATRLRLHISARSAALCSIEVTDMGFGEMFPSSNKTWTESLEL